MIKLDNNSNLLYYENDWIYLSMKSVTGCEINVTVLFANDKLQKQKNYKLKSKFIE